MRAINIEWDTSDPDINPDEQDLDLPTAMDIPDDIKDDEDKISDYLSNVTGFCHYQYELYDGKEYEVTDFDGTGMLEIERYGAAMRKGMPV